MTREYIKDSIQLYGVGDDGRFTHTFRILGTKPSEGASSVCYEAYYEGSGRGILKEFYPQEILFRPRDKEGQQLICSGEFAKDIDDFRKKCESYTAPYIELQKMKRDEKYHELATFIPPFEIYYGLEANSTVYIWTPMPKFLTFDEFCSDIHEHPVQGAGYKFIQVIDAVRYIARCAALLQSGGLVNRDIKPSNIGFFRRGGEIQPQTLAMFDIDSVCFAYSAPDEIAGSEGYIEPEIRNTGYKPNYQTDIYSIGAVLFHALIINDEVRANDFLYDDKYYSRLDEFVSTSELIRNAGADYNIKSKLINILRNCLCGRDRRYRDPLTGNALGCEKLIEDLDALFNDYTRHSGTLYDKRKKYLIDLEMNAELVMLYHLYEHPLYYFAKNQRDINVVLLGFGKYSDKFLDACLQAGQMIDKVLNVKIILESLADRDEYLRDRPEIAKFFNINGSLSGKTGKTGKTDDGYDVYGNIDFIENSESNSDFTAKTQYIFIDLNDDGENLRAARSLALETGKNCYVNFVRTCKPENEHEKFDEGIIPVYVNADVSRLAGFYEIERMAFNAHLSWLPDMNIDQKKEREENFLNPYNHMGSIANVMNMKYKLAGLSLEYDNLSLDEAARRFNAFLNSSRPDDIKRYNELICIEHRRWTTERLCDGCRLKLPEECSSDSDTKTRETEGRRRVTHHVCLVRSKANQILHDEWDNDMRKWNDEDYGDISQLDELDRMSVELHRVFLARAKEAMKGDILGKDILSRICTLIESEPLALSAFNDLCICMRDLMMSVNDIHTGSARRKVTYYNKLSKALKDILSSPKISHENQDEAEREIKTLEGKFTPVLDSMRFRDYKHSDTDLIESIPFILTYSDNITLVVPYIDDVQDKTKFFGNAASAIVINPSRIIYLSYIQDDEDLEKLMNSVKSAGAYIRSKNLRAVVEFMIVKNSYIELPENINTEIINAFPKVSVKILEESDEPVYDEAEAVKIIFRQLELESKISPVFAIEKNNSPLSGMIASREEYKSFAHYEFVSKTMSFRNMHGCELFSYIRNNHSHSIMRSDMFAVSSVITPEFFRDYNKLWLEYYKHKSSWKTLCDGLGDYEKVKSVIAEFSIVRDGQKQQVSSERRYILPSVCRDSVEYIFRALKSNNVIEARSIIRNYMTSSFEVIIADRCNYGEKYNALFGDPYKLMSLDALALNDDGGEKLEVKFDGLISENVSIPGFKTGIYDSVIERMKFFRDIGFVCNLRINAQNGSMGFTYASRDIKQLMTTSGRILEIYTYHKARELGYFDDVVSSLGIKWGQDMNLRNEFDCILTKGFRTLFIECKARNVLEQGMYSHLDALSRQLGINCTPVLVADCEKDNNNSRNAKINHDMRTRGRELGIITVWQSDEIANIGETLMHIMDGSYKPKY